MADGDTESGMWPREDELGDGESWRSVWEEGRQATNGLGEVDSKLVHTLWTWGLERLKNAPLADQILVTEVRDTFNLLDVP